MVGSQECSCLTETSDLSVFHNVYYDLVKSFFTTETTVLCSKHGTLSCRNLDRFEPEGSLLQCRQQAAWHATNMQTMAYWNWQSWLMNLIEVKRSETNPSVCKWIVDYMVIAFARGRLGAPSMNTGMFLPRRTCAKGVSVLSNFRDKPDCNHKFTLNTTRDKRRCGGCSKIARKWNAKIATPQSAKFVAE